MRSKLTDIVVLHPCSAHGTINLIPNLCRKLRLNPCSQAAPACLSVMSALAGWRSIWEAITWTSVGTDDALLYRNGLDVTRAIFAAIWFRVRSSQNMYLLFGTNSLMRGIALRSPRSGLVIGSLATSVLFFSSWSSNITISFAHGLADISVVGKHIDSCARTECCSIVLMAGSCRYPAAVDM
jgi:hypothetical protein